MLGSEMATCLCRTWTFPQVYRRDDKSQPEPVFADTHRVHVDVASPAGHRIAAPVEHARVRIVRPRARQRHALAIVASVRHATLAKRRPEHGQRCLAAAGEHRSVLADAGKSPKSTTTQTRMAWPIFHNGYPLLVPWNGNGASPSYFRDFHPPSSTMARAIKKLATRKVSRTQS